MAPRKKLIWTSKALRDLSGIEDYITEESCDPSVAESYVRRIYDVGGGIPDRIEDIDICRAIPEARGMALKLKELLFENYRIMFLIRDDQVLILRVLHGRRLVTKSLLNQSFPR